MLSLMLLLLAISTSFVLLVLLYCISKIHTPSKNKMVFFFFAFSKFATTAFAVFGEKTIVVVRVVHRRTREPCAVIS